MGRRLPQIFADKKQEREISVDQREYIVNKVFNVFACHFDEGRGEIFLETAATSKISQSLRLLRNDMKLNLQCSESASKNLSHFSSGH
jgi:hypothetical protein